MKTAATPKPKCQPKHLREQPADQRAGRRPDIDGGAEYHEAVGASRLVVRRIQRTDLRGDIALEQTGARDQQRQGEQERLIESHGDVARRHRDRAQHHGIALPDPAIGDQPAQQRREIHQPGVQAKYLRGKRLGGQGPAHGLQRAAELRESRHVLDVPGQQQLIHHVKDQQRRHAVEGESFPRLGEGEVEQSGGVPQEPRGPGMPIGALVGLHGGSTLQR